MTANDRIVSVERLTKRYGRLTAVSDISFDLQAGSIVALLGPNGAGKTTTFRCILGVTGFEGKINVAGNSVKRAGKAVRKAIGYLPQTPAFDGDDTCFEALRFLADLRRLPVSRVNELLERVHLENQKHMRTSELSGGMRQRLALAAALLSDPPLLLLDEPTANLDFASRDEFHELLLQLRDEGKTIVLSTHFVDHIAHLADRILLLSGGGLVLDKTIDEIAPEQGKDFVVHLNGTAAEAFVDALKAIGISEGGISPSRRNLETLITRALRNSEEAQG